MIHQYKLCGYNIVLDVCSGAIHVVDDIAYDMIAGFEGMPREALLSSLLSRYADRTNEQELAEAYDQLLALKAAGKLFTEDTYEPMAGTLKAKTSGVIKALCLHVAHVCNLNCSYCFASQGKYHGERALMSFETGKRALDFLVEHSGSRKNLEVDFFGGEPLMNFQVVKDLVAYARSIEPETGKHFRFTLTTNGMLVDDDVIDFCNRECHNVVLSLDGRKEIHDRFRRDYAGNGSWDRIVPKFQRFVEARGGKGCAAGCQSYEAAGDTGPRRISHVFERYGQVRETERLHQSDLGAVLLDHARHGSEGTERRHEEKHQREYIGQIAHALRVRGKLDVVLVHLAA